MVYPVGCRYARYLCVLNTYGHLRTVVILIDDIGFVHVSWNVSLLRYIKF